MTETPRIPEVRIEADAEGLHISPIWQGVDRPNTGGVLISDTPANRMLADRLKKAIEAGVCYRFESICTDRNGKTYVGAHAGFMGRTLNADLRRLGF